MKSPKDTLFATPQKRAPFRFDERVAEVFDDMLERSVPCYKEVQGRILSLIRQTHPAVQHIVDLGCSTGNLLFDLAQNLHKPSIRYTGYDNSSFMIEKAKENLFMRRLKGRFSFVVKDIRECACPDADVVILNYTLQFLALKERKVFLKTLCRGLKKGCLVIVSDKTLSHSRVLARSFSKIHEEFKLDHHYSRLEIAQKRRALENVLIPVSFDEHFRMIREAGFTAVEPFFTWFNFSSFAAVR